jgi:putative DNA primase/helicase
MNNNMQLKNAMQAAGITPPHEIIADSTFRSFSSSGKLGDKAGWYIGFADGICTFCFGCFRLGISQTWSADNGRKLTSHELVVQSQRNKAMRILRDAEIVKNHAAAKLVANSIWMKAKPVVSHDYLTKKGVDAFGIRQLGDSLIITLTDGNEIHSLQYIKSDGTKKFLFGGRIKGCYFIIGNPTDIIYIAEGYATAASIHMATGCAVVVAFNAGNLLEVAKTIRAKYPKSKIVIAGDDDPSGVGINKANEAAIQVGADVVMPSFGDNRPDKATDFNDLHQLFGLEVVKQQLTLVKSPVSNLIAASDKLPPAINNQWLMPVSLQQESESHPYPLNALPAGIGDAVREVLEFVQCPLALAACCALSALSVSAQHIANVRRAEGLVGPVSLFVLAIAESGERKSSVDKHFTSAIIAWEAGQAELTKPEVIRYQVEHDSWLMQYEGLKQKIKDTAKGRK